MKNIQKKNKEACRLAIVVMVEHDNLTLEQLTAIKNAIETIKRGKR